MKKLFTAAVALICITMVIVSFTACGDDDNETNGSPAQTRTLSAAEVCYMVHMPNNGRKICDYIVSYIDADGQEKTGMLADTAWVKKITVKNFPFTATIKMNVQRNGNELTDSSYNFKVYYAVYSITSIYSDGTKEVNYKDLTPSYDGQACKANKAEAYIAERLSVPGHLKTKSIDLSTNGKVLYYQQGKN